MTVNNATLNAGNAVVVGGWNNAPSASSQATFTVGGSSTCNISDLYVAAFSSGAQGTVTVQDTATVTVNGAIYINKSSSPATAGTFNQTGGTVSTSALYIGGSGGVGADSFNQSGGLFTVTGAAGISSTKSGVLALSGGTLNMSGNAISGVNFQFSGGTLTNAGSVTCDIALSGTATVIDNDASHNGAISGAISGTGASLTKVGLGTITLNGANSYDGATNVQAGGLTLGDSATFTAGGAVTMQNGTTLATSTATVALNRDLVFGTTNYVVGMNATGFGSAIAVNQLSALTDGNKVLVSVSGTSSFSGTGTIITYSTAGTAIPQFRSGDRRHRNRRSLGN